MPGADGEPEPLAARLERNGSATLILPPLVTYFPCARLPELRDGAVEVPDTLVSHPNQLSPIRYPLTSPFVGLLDVYRLRELPLSVEGNDVPAGVVVYDVEERLPGRELRTGRVLGSRSYHHAMKRVAILQSCYIPWKGYFDLINSVDEFVLYDEVQYTRQDWRNRNRIKTPRGTRWLTIPVTVDDLYHQRLDETEVADPNWSRSHWETIRQSYRDAPYFRTYAGGLEASYAACATRHRLSEINRYLLETVCEILEIGATFTWSTEYAGEGGRTERVVSLCQQTGATVYLSGPSARAYLDETLFEQAGIELRYFDYDGYPEYPQLHPPFEHDVTILDLLFNAGPDAPFLMKSFPTPTRSRV